jgi:hypothetical protein
VTPIPNIVPLFLAPPEIRRREPVSGAGADAGQAVKVTGVKYMPLTRKTAKAGYCTENRHISVSSGSRDDPPSERIAREIRDSLTSSPRNKKPAGERRVR